MQAAHHWRSMAVCATLGHTCNPSRHVHAHRRVLSHLCSPIIQKMAVDIATRRYDTYDSGRFSPSLPPKLVHGAVIAAGVSGKVFCLCKQRSDSSLTKQSMSLFSSSPWWYGSALLKASTGRGSMDVTICLPFGVKCCGREGCVIVRIAFAGVK